MLSEVLIPKLAFPLAAGCKLDATGVSVVLVPTPFSKYLKF